MRDLIDNGKIKVLVKSNSVEDQCRSLEYATLNLNYMQEMSKQAKGIIEQKLTIDSYVSAMENVLVNYFLIIYLQK